MIEFLHISTGRKQRDRISLHACTDGSSAADSLQTFDTQSESSVIESLYTFVSLVQLHHDVSKDSEKVCTAELCLDCCLQQRTAKLAKSPPLSHGRVAYQR